MCKKTFEIKGKSGTFQIERNLESSRGLIRYNFCYKNDDIIFMYEEFCDYDDFGFISFKVHLEELLNSSPSSNLEKRLYKNSKAALEQELRLKKRLRKIVDFFSRKSSINVSNYCSWFTYDNFLTFEIKKDENSSDYIVEFEMPDPYKVSFSDDDELIFKGSLLVSRQELINFYHEL